MSSESRCCQYRGNLRSCIAADGVIIVAARLLMMVDGAGLLGRFDSRSPASVLVSTPCWLRRTLRSSRAPGRSSLQSSKSLCPQFWGVSVSAQSQMCRESQLTQTQCSLFMPMGTLARFKVLDMLLKARRAESNILIRTGRADGWSTEALRFSLKQ